MVDDGATAGRCAAVAGLADEIDGPAVCGTLAGGLGSRFADDGAEGLGAVC